MTDRHPFKAQERDSRAWPVIRLYLEQYGTDSGHEYPVNGIEGHGAANEARLSLRRGARHHGARCAAWVTGQDGNPCNPATGSCRDASAPHGVRFTLWSEDTARRHVAGQAGGNAAGLAYNPFRRGEARWQQQQPRHLRGTG